MVIAKGYSVYVACHKLVLKSVSYPKIEKNTPILIQQSIACHKVLNLHILGKLIFIGSYGCQTHMLYKPKNTGCVKLYRV